MAVQIPTVQRNAPIAEPSVGRVDIQPTDISSAQNVVRSATTGLVNASLTAFEEHKNRAAETIAKDAAYKYNKLLRQQYEGGEGKLGLKHMDGDPGPGYTQFRQYTDDQYNSIFSEYGEASDRVKIAIKGQLDQVKNKFSDIAISSEAAQLDKWQTSVTQNSVAMAKEDILDQSGTFTTKDLEGKPIADPYMDFDTTLAKISNTWMEHGKDRGTVKEVLDKEGKPVLNAKGEKTYVPSTSVAFRIAKDKSDAIENVINNLRTSGRVDEAVEVAAHYKDIIDAAARPKINKELEEATLEKNAYSELAKVQHLPILEAQKQLDKISDQKLQEKALEKFGTYKARIDKLNDLQEEQYHSSITKDLINKQIGEDPFLTVDEMMSDPKFKERIEKVTKPQNLKAIMALVKPKEESDPQANIDYMTDAVSGALNGISKEQLTVKLAPISKKDQKWALDLYKFVNLDTESEKRSRLNSVIPKLKEALVLQKVVDREIPGRGNSPKDAEIISAAMQEVGRYLGEIPQDATQQQLWVDKFTTEIKGRVKPGRIQEFIDNTFGSTIKAAKEAMGVTDQPILTPRNVPVYTQPTPAPGPTPAPRAPTITASPTPFKSSTTPTPTLKSLQGVSSRQLIKMYFDKYPDRKNKVPSIEDLQQFQNEISK